MKFTYSAEIEAIRTEGWIFQAGCGAGKHHHHPWHALSSEPGGGAGS
jgi:hypothetical protein